MQTTIIFKNAINQERFWEAYGEAEMKEICKNCANCVPAYKGQVCRLTEKKVKQDSTCDKWRKKS